VNKAFKKLDRDGSGEIDIRDLEGVYNAKNHPDVKSGQKTELQVLSEFLDTFEIHTGTHNKNYHDGCVTLQEFTDYYRKLSANIDNDQYFELMMTNSWGLDNKSYRKGVEM